jgi:putative endonuclease
MSNKTLGNFGESLARDYLKTRGYRILEENFRNKLGEIDLIAQDGKTVCFVEVKTRQTLEQGQPYESVTPWKIRKLSQMATFYLKHKFHALEIPARFDVISIVQDRSGSANVQHIKNAFDSVY